MAYKLKILPIDRPGFVKNLRCIVGFHSEKAELYEKQTLPKVGLSLQFWLAKPTFGQHIS